MNRTNDIKELAWALARLVEDNERRGLHGSAVTLGKLALKNARYDYEAAKAEMT